MFSQFVRCLDLLEAEMEARGIAYHVLTGETPTRRREEVVAGFLVTYFDRDDTEAARRMGHALGWDKGEDPMNLESDLFATYTLVTKPKWANRSDPR